MDHPIVEIFWNFWPFTFFFWLPARFGLNSIFLPLWLLTWWYSTLWNLINESIWRIFYWAFWLIFIASESLLTWFVPLFFLITIAQIFFIIMFDIFGTTLITHLLTYGILIIGITVGALCGAGVCDGTENDKTKPSTITTSSTSSSS